MEKSIRVMSFNVRVENPRDGENRFEYRKERIVTEIERQSPDLIGFQECTGPMRRWLREHLWGYLLVGCGRNGDYCGEGIPVAIRQSKFDIISLNHYWLSPEPFKAGSTYGGDQSRFPRMYLDVRLKKEDCDRVIRIINIHTDHSGSRARVLETTQLIRTLAQEGTEDQILAITGDFNAVPDSPEILYMTQGAPQLNIADTSAGIGETYHGFGAYDPIKIDYIFSNTAYRGSARIHQPPQDGVYLSDHDPIVTELIYQSDAENIPMPQAALR